MTYSVILDEFTQRALTEYQTAKLAMAMGAEVEVPDVTDLRAQFDDLLCRPPRASTVDPAEQAVRYALGIKGG